MIAGMVGVIGSFMPWVKAPIVGSVSGTDGSDGLITIALAVLASLVGLVGVRAMRLSIAPRVIVAALGVALAAMGLHKLIGLHDLKAEMANDSGFGQMLSDAVRPGEGLYMLVVSGGLLVLFSVLSPSKPRTYQPAPTS